MSPTLSYEPVARQPTPGGAAGATHRRTIALAVVAVLLLVVAVVATPARVARVVRLDWEVGDIRPVLQLLRVALVVAAALLWGFRRSIFGALDRLPPGELSKIAALLLVSTVLSLACAEAALRIVHYPFSGAWTPPETVIARFDPQLGWSYIPGLSSTQTVSGRTTPLFFDRAGIRVGAPNHVWQADSPTVLFIGDSFTFGHGVSYGESFPARVEGLLGGRVQTVDLGVQAYGTDQSLLALERYIDRFHTRDVVYTYIPDHIRRNDNYDRRLYMRSGRWPGTKPLFAVRADGSVYEKKHPVRMDRVSDFHLWHVAQLAWVRWGPRPDPNLTTALIRELKRYCDSKNVRLLVVDWTWDVGPSDLAIFKGTGADVLDVGIGAPSDWPTWRLPGDGHPTPAAHERVAKLIAQRLLSTDPGLRASAASGEPR